LKTDDTLDIITNIMEKHDIDIFVAQETWRHGKERESESIVVNDTQIFLHGTVDQDPQNKRGSGGVAVFLSKNAKQAWINAGKPEPILGGPSPDHARYMGIKLHFKTKKIVHKFFLVTAYHPHSGKDADIINKIYDSLDQFISQAPQEHHILMGSDANASLGTAAADEISILGNFGVTTKKNGECEFQLTNLL
jgi:exonuclease III